MYASAAEQQDTSSAQTSPTEADDASSLADVDIRKPAPACLGEGVAMAAPSSNLPRLSSRAVAARASTGGTGGTLLAAAPIITEARLGSATPGLALAIGYNIEGALA